MFSSWDEMAIVGVFFILFLNSHWIGGQKFNFLDTQEAGYDEAHPLSPPKWQRKQYLSLQLFYYQYSFFVIIFANMTDLSLSSASTRK